MVGKVVMCIKFFIACSNYIKRRHCLPDDRNERQESRWARKSSSSSIDSSIYPRCNRPVNERNWPVIFASERGHSVQFGAIKFPSGCFKTSHKVVSVREGRTHEFANVDKSILNWYRYLADTDNKRVLDQ